MTADIVTAGMMQGRVARVNMFWFNFDEDDN